jgi:hypothetical protein
MYNLQDWILQRNQTSTQATISDWSTFPPSSTGTITACVSYHSGLNIHTYILYRKYAKNSAYHQVELSKRYSSKLRTVHYFDSSCCSNIIVVVLQV